MVLPEVQEARLGHQEDGPLQGALVPDIPPQAVQGVQPIRREELAKGELPADWSGLGGLCAEQDKPEDQFHGDRGLLGRLEGDEVRLVRGADALRTDGLRAPQRLRLQLEK